MKLVFLTYNIIKILFVGNKHWVCKYSDIHPLCKNVFLLVYSNKILCLGKVITFYEKCGQRHAWVEKPAGFLDHLSYISIKVYLPVSQQYFSCENFAGDITIHI